MSQEIATETMNQKSHNVEPSFQNMVLVKSRDVSTSSQNTGLVKSREASTSSQNTGLVKSRNASQNTVLFLPPVVLHDKKSPEQLKVQAANGLAQMSIDQLHQSVVLSHSARQEILPPHARQVLPSARQETSPSARQETLPSARQGVSPSKISSSSESIIDIGKILSKRKRLNDAVEQKELELKELIDKRRKFVEAFDQLVNDD